jgi:hypothetical protein
LAAGRLWSPDVVWLAEIAIGTSLAAYFVRAGVTYRRRLQTAA